MGDLVSGVSGVVKTAFLRGSSTKSDISFVENTEPTDEGIYKTDVGEYIPAEADYVDYDDTSIVEMGEAKEVSVELFDTPLDPIDTSPMPCPEGSYLAEDNSCMSVDTEIYDFASELEANTVTPVIDTSPIPCPEGTYLNAENACMYLETEEFDFTAATSSNIDTGLQSGN